MKKYDELSLSQKVIWSMWVFKVKYHSNGLIARFKASLVPQSFSQVQRVDFSEIVALTIRTESLQIYLAFRLMLNLFIH